MPKIIVLGSAYSIPDEQHENTHLMVVSENHTVLVDCVGNPIVRLQKANANLDNISDLILTHFHPDHVSGVPLLLMDLWLLGRRESLAIHGLDHTLDRLERVMQCYEPENWPDFFPLRYHPLPESEMVDVIHYPDLSIKASPVKHLLPTIGLRFEFGGKHKSAAYSSDTEPCDAVIKLAEQVNLLIHESTGASQGHSSAAQAGMIAQQAEALSLALIHYPTRGVDLAMLENSARQAYQGPVCIARDFMSFDME